MRNQYMVEFRVPFFTEDMLKLIPEQKEVLKALFSEDKLISYSIALDRTKVWGLFLAEDEESLEESLHRLPLTIFMEYDYKALMVHNSVHLIPTMSLN